MLKKNYAKTGRSCRITFKVPAGIEAESVAVLGDFNDWDAERHPLTRRKDGSHSRTLSLATGQEYRFRYLLDDEQWMNDEEADRQVPNGFGTMDAVISI